MFCTAQFESDSDSSDSVLIRNLILSLSDSLNMIDSDPDSDLVYDSCQSDSDSDCCSSTSPIVYEFEDLIKALRSYYTVL